MMPTLKDLTAENVTELMQILKVTGTKVTQDTWSSLNEDTKRNFVYDVVSLYFQN